MTLSALLEKYDVPVPRYTSYPTVPQWRQSPTTEQWTASLARAATGPDAALAVYVHLPFCESLCSFCGCNNVITRDHERETPYVDLVLAELRAYLAAVPALGRQPFQQLHLGGGTPTFLSAASLTRLVAGLYELLPKRTSGFEGSVEVDPRVTNVGQLAALRSLGFSRVSLGVQDIDPHVQHLVNRIQPLEQTERLCFEARRLDYESVNFDLIYGLPGQTPDTIAALAREVLRLAPDRLAVYSFARVPWIKPQQRRFKDDQIPAGAAKRALYEAIREPLVAGGYIEIGLDHFAKPGDALARVAAEGRLHRNFMGYTEVRTTTLLGLGVSAISETPDCYHQNEKVLPSYETRVLAGGIPTLRGHLLSDDDMHRRDLIFALMTRFRVAIEDGDIAADDTFVRELVNDGLMVIEGGVLTVPEQGRAFLRNVAAVFDAHLGAQDLTRPTYSTSA
ncbi:MAG: oxygen-independent coproporphyrinogen III oxidase [Acidobacteria bacterium]|nr:oxygen-independent coproporphyrinogen III oxidase [Acidobacteriota bacterium]